MLSDYVRKSRLIFSYTWGDLWVKSEKISGADTKQKHGYSNCCFFFFWSLFSCCCSHRDITELCTSRPITATELGKWEVVQQDKEFLESEQLSKDNAVLQNCKTPKMCNITDSQGLQNGVWHGPSSTMDFLCDLGQVIWLSSRSFSLFWI